MKTPNRLYLVIICIVIICFAVVSGSQCLPGESKQFSYISAVSDGNWTVITGNDGNTYYLCDSRYLGSIGLSNTTVYYRTINRKKIITEFIIPDVTWLKRTFCEVGLV